MLQEAGQDVHLFVFHKEGDFIPPQNVTIHYLFEAGQKTFASGAETTTYNES